MYYLHNNSTMLVPKFKNKADYASWLSQLNFCDSSRFFIITEFFFINNIFLYKLKLLWKHIFIKWFLHFNRSFEWRENKTKEFTIDYTPSKFFEITSKYRTEKLETKNQTYRNTKKHTESRKPSFTRRIGRKYRLLGTTNTIITNTNNA